MTKSDLVERMGQILKLPRGRAELLVNTVFEAMEAALRDGERIEIRGFGSFEIRSYKSYDGRNPRTGERVPVAPKRLPFFKVGKELRERVNDGAATKPWQRRARPTTPEGEYEDEAPRAETGVGDSTGV